MLTQTSSTTSHNSAKSTDREANSRGGRRRAGAHSARPHHSAEQSQARTPAAASGIRPSRAPATMTVTEARKRGSAVVARRSARSSIRERSIVGQSVTRVPVTVSPIQPRTRTAVCARSSRPWMSSA